MIRKAFIMHVHPDKHAEYKKYYRCCHCQFAVVHLSLPVHENFPGHQAKSGVSTRFSVGAFLSGGIDSAVTSTLCARTGRSVLALNMPIYQATDQVTRSFEHIQWLEETYEAVRGIDVDLTPTFRTIEETLPTEIQDGLSMANTRSRLRMLTLYAFSTHYRMLVADRVESRPAWKYAPLMQ